MFASCHESHRLKGNDSFMTKRTNVQLLVTVVKVDDRRVSGDTGVKVCH